MASSAELRPVLERRVRGGVAFWTDPLVVERRGVVIGFSERGGGVSEPPYASLNLAAHVGDDLARVDRNRDLLLSALGLDECRASLTLAEQVHGARVEVVRAQAAGSGAWAAEGRRPVPGADALITAERDVPLLLCFADCVPVVLVAPGPVVGVVHAGWRGALASLPAQTAARLATEAACEPGEISAYLGPHIGGCHYPTSDDILSHFCNTFGTVARARTGGLDLDAVVRKSLVDAGVAEWRITSLGVCTAEATESFFSYRAENGITGRHGALVCIAAP